MHISHIPTPVSQHACDTTHKDMGGPTCDRIWGRENTKIAEMCFWDCSVGTGRIATRLGDHNRHWSSFGNKNEHNAYSTFLKMRHDGFWSASIFGVWSRKIHNFLLHWKFSLFSTQQKCAGNKRNKTSRLSASFCTKNHLILFSSLRERVDWRCHASSKKVSKLKTRVLGTYHAWLRSLTNYSDGRSYI